MYIYIALGLVILYFIIEKLGKTIKNNKKFLYGYDEITNDILHVSINRESTPEYDFSFEYHDVKYVFKILKCPSNGEIVINNKTRWQINLNMRVGKAPTSSISVKNLDGFMKLEGDNIKKFCLVYKDCYSIKQWVNECEMKFINTNKDVCYGIKFIKFDEFKSLIEEIKNN